MNISTGKINLPQRIVLYGVEGIGKTTLASQFPDPVFIDTEGSTYHMDVKRFDKPLNWDMLLDQVRYVSINPNLCKTLVIDTADWAETLCIESLCAQNKWESIETPGYGKGYVELAEEFGKLLNLLTTITKKGIHVIFTAHAITRKFELPDEDGAFDKYELKLQRKTAPLLKEWADAVIFLNFKTVITNKDKNGNGKGKGQNRMMYLNHTAVIDAKNRWGLDDYNGYHLDYLIIEPFISNHELPTVNKPQNATTAQKSSPERKEERLSTQRQEAPQNEPQNIKQAEQDEELSCIPEALRQLMEKDGVSLDEVKAAVYAKGYFPLETPFKNYPERFVTGNLIAGWNNGLIQTIHQLRSEEKINF